jgi:hypothetical protein
MMSQILQHFYSVLSFTGTCFSATLGLSIIVPKLGDALWGRILSGSLEKQRAAYNQQLEEQKAAYSQQLEEHKQELVIYFSRKKVILDAHYQQLNELRCNAVEIYNSRISDPDLKYTTISFFLDQIETSSLLVRQALNSHFNAIYDFTEEPLCLVTEGFCDKVNNLIYKLICDIDELLLQEDE